MSEHHWVASDGMRLFYRTVGEGRPVVLLHGLFSDSNVNWVKFGAAEAIATKGFKLILPDLRAHGQSDKPQEAEAYPRGILARDLTELIAHLGLADGAYDLGGFSLGARTTVQGLGEGLRPRRAVVAGMGYEGLAGWLGRKAFFSEAIDRFHSIKQGEPHYFAVQFMKTQKIDLIAARHLLATFEDAPISWLDAFTMLTGVVCGTEDQDNGSAERLAEAMPDARYIPVPGTHMSSVAKPEFGRAIADFLSAAA